MSTLHREKETFRIALTVEKNTPHPVQAEAELRQHIKNTKGITLKALEHAEEG